ncbi:glycosyltransferase family 39 protein [Antrihabitans cavernicola]|uniref:Glycosyltransferase family 39 protein n=1 Tax=Antrihabitans cavernicola TaxID=2495913 RepID=A0A5A7S4T8_9NOCA|nr:glycosyltransferase family 39 protein [Spelaeibacter cavernicola]KAA0021190.1 glycosyltransferase family 39 protein [Spelaeibacter cavernicola]
MTLTTDAERTTEPTVAIAAVDAHRSRRLTRRTWERGGLVALLLATAIAYLWNITVNGMGNQFYAGAAQAGSKNWEALLFGSLDTGNFITVDKPPVSQWVMGLSGQLFGFSSASMMIPQALMAVAAVALLYGAVARVSGNGAGLLAGSALALTPVAALMFRFNNPDAAMVLLMMAGAYCTIRALEKASVRWLALAGVALGFAFLAKMLEGLMVLPALGLAYLVVAPTSFRKRILHLLGAAVALTLSSGWYVLITLLWPASSRPYMAGSTDNNFMNLVLGYNGLARVLGRNHGGGGAAGGHGGGGAMPGGFTPPSGAAMNHGGGHGGFGSQSTGLARLFGGELGFEISWLLPAALIALVLVLVARGRRPRTDLIRGAAIVFGGWLVVDGLVFSYMNGMFHAYYTLAIAPAIAGLIGLGVREMWTVRDRALGRFGSAAIVLALGGWGFVLLGRNADWFPWLRWAILVVTVVAAFGLVGTSIKGLRRFTGALLIAGVIAGLGGSAAYAVATIGQPHTGGSPTVGPASSGQDHGGFGGQGQDNPALDSLLESTTTRWSAAVNRSSAAAALELPTGTAVMAIGGFSNDPTPTLAQFIGYVKDHQVSYYVAQSNGGRGGQSAPTASTHAGAQGNSTHPKSTTGGSTQNRSATAQSNRGGSSTSPSGQIASWVAANFTPTTVGTATVYNLSGYAG